MSNLDLIRCTLSTK